MNVAIVGTGRVASVLGAALIGSDVTISAVVGRNALKRNTLAKQLNTVALDFNDDLPESAVVLVAVSDAAIAEVSEKLRASDAVVVHTSGTTDINALKNHKLHGVLWPIQSMIAPPIDLQDVPLIIEGNTEKARDTINGLALSISNKVVEVGIKRRKQMHLAAVLVSNFPVHLMVKAGEIMKAHDLDPDLMLPLWRGMAERVSDEGTDAKLTGPARRGDMNTISEHLNLLANEPDLHAIYESLTQSILHQYHGKTDV